MPHKRFFCTNGVPQEHFQFITLFEHTADNVPYDECYTVYYAYWGECINNITMKIEETLQSDEEQNLQNICLQNRGSGA